MMSANNSRSKQKWHVHLGDFANMLKAFIGSNYLGVPFAFLQSGLGLGIAGLFLIASLTDHCCHLLVKTKYHAIKKVLQLHKEKEKNVKKLRADYTYGHSDSDDGSDSARHTGKFPYPLATGSPNLSDDDYDTSSKTGTYTESAHYPALRDSPLMSDDDTVIYDIDTASLMEQHMLKHMSYGDVGQISMGRIGLFIVNTCICVTQFCFCVTYFIFVGNTIFSLFPTKVCSDTGNSSMPNTTMEVCDLHYTSVLSTTEMPHHTPHVRSLDGYPLNISQTFPVATDFDSLAENGSFFNNTSSIFAYASTPSLTSLLTSGQSSSTQVSITTSQQSTPSSLTPDQTTSAGDVESSNQNNTKTREEKVGPSLPLMVLSPLPIFILFALIRSIRNMGWISVLADISIFVGCVSVLSYILYDFNISSDFIWIRWKGLPLFFGMLTASYEGIGLIIPVESSMEGNRHRFGAFLHGAVGCVSMILTLFAVLGYLRFGGDIKQMLNTNIPPSTWVSFSTNICVVVGVILTFPLQIYPVIEMAEVFLFSEGHICGPKKKKGQLLDDEDDNKDTGDKSALLPQRSSLDLPVSVAAHIPKSVSAWKRNLVRVFLVLLAASLAVLFRDSFAYVSAFTGAIGSSLLAYILPCLFHVKLCYHELPIGVIIKDVVIIILGTICSIISLVTVIEKLINNTIV